MDLSLFLFCTISAGRPSICLYFYYFLYTGNCQANGMTHIWWAVQWEKIVK